MASTQQELSKLTVFELRKQLKKRKLPVAGVKAALIKRLIEEEEESAPATKKHLPTMAAPQAKPGHISRECPQAGGGGEGGNIDNGCSNSNEPVHISRECPQAGGGGGATLIKKLVGTLDQNEINNDSDTDSVCSNCNDLGHFSRECPYAGGGGGHGGSGNVCSNCNEPGCFSRECLQGCGAVVGGIQMDTRGSARASRVAARQQSASTLPRTTTTTVAAVVVPPPTTITPEAAAATVPTSSSSSTTVSSKKALKRQRNNHNKKKEKLLVVVPKGKIPLRVTHDPGLPEDTFEVSKVLASAAYNGERLYYLEWKNFRGHDSWIRSSWSDSLEITAEFLEDSTMDTVLAALTGQAVAQHLLLKLEKRPLYRQLIVKLGTGPVLSTDIAFCAEATDKQRTEAAASLMDFIKKEF
ncbi:hypothetical protein GPALN_014987 [Globodera pallida]|nr:hypothetical protein GPALN_014987 [Globodera pallida]